MTEARLEDIGSSWREGLFEGKRAVVTGAASGIGRAIAVSLCDLGADVVAVDLQAQGLDALGAAEVLVGDLTSETFRSEITRVAGGIDYLVQVAGFQKLVRPETATLEDWDRLFDVNVKAPFFLTREIGPAIRDGGRIVFFSSVAARSGETPETVIYAAAKTALLSVTRSYAYIYGPRGICVNAILPGSTDTPMQDLVISEIAAMRGMTYDDLEEKRLQVVALGRRATPEEVGASVVWLLSPAGRYVTGQGLAIDGGYTMF